MGRRSEREVIVVEQGGSSLLWLLVGGAVGAGLALLFAPQSGVKTRRALSQRIASLKESAEEVYEEFTDALDSDAEDGEEEEALEAEPEAVEEEAVKAPVSRGRRGSSPARKELEKRLAAARARRTRALLDEDEEPVA